MRITIWVNERTWQAAVDLAQGSLGLDHSFDLLFVIDDEVSAVLHGSYASLLGRGHRERDPGNAWDATQRETAETVLTKAADRLGAPCQSVIEHGRPEREITKFLGKVRPDILVLIRDGESTRLGPHSLERIGRFVIDHAPCGVLVGWPGEPPSIARLPR